MDCNCQRISYRETGAFSSIVSDYVENKTKLSSFYLHNPTPDGLKAAIQAKKTKDVDRALLISELRKQYSGLGNESINRSIELLGSSDTFTITTAHQPNILTGPLYFIYKIVHTISLAKYCKKLFPEQNFVPVFYMGSEDADLDELGHLFVEDTKYTWNTHQKGAVGRMTIDRDFLRIIDELESRLAVLPNGKRVMELIRSCYSQGRMIQDATFQFVNELFKKDGLLVLIPDSAGFKSAVAEIFRDDLINQSASEIVQTTIAQIDEAGYKVQANPREINLFYLDKGIRERIVKSGDRYSVLNTSLEFSEKDLLQELENHPERFSPNVILRGVFQEMILPNIAFVGGGGELAYWLQYRQLFENYSIPFPVLVLRNSFLFVPSKEMQKIKKLRLSPSDFFKEEDKLFANLVNRETTMKIKLNGSLEKVEELYGVLRQQVEAVDKTLSRHVESLKTRAVDKLIGLEKKMLRAEKRKFTSQQRQIQDIRARLFPKGKLQERHDNVLYYLSAFGDEFIELIKKNSPALEQEFTILTIE